MEKTLGWNSAGKMKNNFYTPHAMFQLADFLFSLCKAKDIFIKQRFYLWFILKTLQVFQG